MTFENVWEHSDSCCQFASDPAPVLMGAILLQNVGGRLGVKPGSHRLDAEVTFHIYRFPILFLDVFWEQHQSRFVLAGDLHINILRFVAGHGTVVQPVSINIVFECKQAQQYGRTHRFHQSCQLEYTKCWIALLARAYHSYSWTLQFSCILYVWVTTRFDVLFKSLNVAKKINIFLAHFRFLKIYLFNATGHHACSPTLPKSPLISSYQQHKHSA